jgi:hypothetical protein
MNKTIQTILLIFTVAFGIALRMSIFGWLFIIGIATILIFGICHLIIHNNARTSLTEQKTANYILIFSSHLFFILIFLFQIDADDSRSYSVIGFVTNNEKTFYTENGFSIVLLSVIAYIVTNIVIVKNARSNKLFKFNSLSFTISTISSFVLLFLFQQLFATNRQISQSKELEKSGEFNSIKRALNNPDKVVVLKINPFENHINEIPKEIFKLPNLVEIDLTDQNISTIPKEITTAKKLEKLNLIGNNITEIPSQLCGCDKLVELRIGGDIKSFPKCLKTMKSLNHLSVQSNSVNELMDELLTFKNITTAHFYLKNGTINGKKLDSIYNETGISHKY